MTLVEMSIADGVMIMAVVVLRALTINRVLKKTSPENKKKWIIDTEAAVVKDIFKMTLEGKGAETIARIL